MWECDFTKIKFKSPARICPYENLQNPDKSHPQVSISYWQLPHVGNGRGCWPLTNPTRRCPYVICYWHSHLSVSIWTRMLAFDKSHPQVSICYWQLPPVGVHMDEDAGLWQIPPAGVHMLLTTPTFRCPYGWGCWPLTNPTRRFPYVTDNSHLSVSIWTRMLASVASMYSAVW